MFFYFPKRQSSRCLRCSGVRCGWDSPPPLGPPPHHHPLSPPPPSPLRVWALPISHRMKQKRILLINQTYELSVPYLPIIGVPIGVCFISNSILLFSPPTPTPPNYQIQVSYILELTPQNWRPHLLFSSLFYLSLSVPPPPPPHPTTRFGRRSTTGARHSTVSK